MPNAECRRWRLWKISRYSKIAFASSTRVRQIRRSRSSTCIRLQNDSIIALSKQLPTAPIEGMSPESSARLVNAQLVNSGALVRVDDGPVGLACLDRHAQGVGDQGGGLGRIDRPAHDPPAE